MNKNTLTLALVAALIAVTSAQLVAGIRIEAVGVASSQLHHCPDQKTLPVQNYYQYKVFGHFSCLTLGDALFRKKPQAPLLTQIPGSAQVDEKRDPAKTKKAWNRLLLSTGNSKPLDLFKSSSRSYSSTGTILTRCKLLHVNDWTKCLSPPQVRIEGNTRNPSGQLVLCVDFIRQPPAPTGRLQFGLRSFRTGDRIPVAWTIQR